MHPTSPLRRSAAQLTACCLAAFLVPQTALLGAAQQEPAQQQQTAPAPQLPADPPTQGSAVPSQDAPPSAPTPQTSPQAQQAPPQQPVLPQQPVGTAAAPVDKPTGIPGSRPSGAAIAPAKQRRVRAIVIRVGLVIAAGAAVGTVIGLTKASHSTPQ